MDGAMPAGLGRRAAYVSERVAPAASTSPRSSAIARVKLAVLTPTARRRSRASDGPRTHSSHRIRTLVADRPGDREDGEEGTRGYYE